MKNTFTLLILLSCFAMQTRSQTVKIPYLIYNAQSSATRVSAVLQKGDTMYISGDFASIGYPDSVGQFGSPVDLSGGGPDLSWPKPNDYVQTAIPDGNGGFYIGGNFTMVGNQARNRVAHIDQNGMLTNQLANVGFGATVYTLALKNNMLYVGGLFTTASDNSSSNITRNRVAAVDLVTNQVTSWNPNANSSVLCIAVYDTTVYVGGSYTNIGGAARANFALLSAFTGNADGWDPGVNGTEVYGMTIAGDTLFLGGKFSMVDGQTRNKLAALKTNTNTLLPWNPDMGNVASVVVRAIAVEGDLVYAGGNFDSVGGQPRKSIVALDRFSGMATAWNPAPASNIIINSIAVRNNVVYAGGNFSNKQIGGQLRTQVVALNATIDTLMALPWTAKVRDLYVNTLTFSGNTLYVGGAFTNMGGFDRSKLAAFNTRTGVICDWNPGADGYASTMALSHDRNTVYLSGGSLLKVAGVSVSRLAAIDAVTGNCSSTWLPSLTSGFASAITSSPGAVYISGSFTTISGQARNRLAAVDPLTGVPSAWHPNANGAVNALVLKGDTLFAGGSFSNIGGQSRNRVASVSTITGNATAFNPNVNNTVNTMALLDSVLYIGGAFTSLNGTSTPRNRLAAINVNTVSTVLPWNPGANNTVSVLTAENNAVYVAGSFTTIGGISGRSYLAVINATTGAVTSSWNPATVVPLTAAPVMIALSENTVYAALSNLAPYLVTLSGDASLPVKFKGIHAVRQENNVRVSWRTASESNNSHFEIERSVDGVSFQLLGTVQGAGNSAVIKSYFYTDRDAFAAGAKNLYYRIKQVDFDNRFSYSETVQIPGYPAPVQPTSFAVYPNPANGNAALDFKGAPGAKTIEVFDLRGNKLQSLASVNDEELLPLSGYAAGVYLIRVITAGRTETMRLLITR